MKYVLAILLAFCGLTSWAEGIWNDVFNWEASLTLTPPYSPATAQNRSGATIGGVEFKGKYSTFTIDDSAIKEKSQSARFYFGYLTQTNEMRAYASSVITVKVAENWLRGRQGRCRLPIHRNTRNMDGRRVDACTARSDRGPI